MSDAEIAANIDDIDGADLIQQFEDSKKIGKRARISDFVSGLVHRDSKTVMANEVTATAPKGSPVDLSDLSDAEIAVMCDEIGDLEDFEATKMGSVATPARQAETAESTREPITITIGEQDDVFDGACI